MQICIFSSLPEHITKHLRNMKFCFQVIWSTAGYRLNAIIAVWLFNRLWFFLTFQKPFLLLDSYTCLCVCGMNFLNDYFNRYFLWNLLLKYPSIYPNMKKKKKNFRVSDLHELKSFWKQLSSLWIGKVQEKSQGNHLVGSTLNYYWFLSLQMTKQKYHTFRIVLEVIALT